MSLQSWIGANHINCEAQIIKPWRGHEYAKMRLKNCENNNIYVHISDQGKRDAT